MKLAETILDWLAESLTSSPPGIVAFSFNLLELGAPSSAHFGIELIGSDQYDSNDSDWACEEIWIASPRRIAIPVELSGSTWQEFLAAAEIAVGEVLNSHTVVSSRLKSARAVAVGFVDGDLKTLWCQPASAITGDSLSQ